MPEIYFESVNPLPLSLGLTAYTRDVLFGEMKLNFDNAQLMIFKDWGTLAGIANLGVICTRGSAAVSRDVNTGR